MSVQKLISDRSDQALEITFDFLELEWDLSETILEFQEQQTRNSETKPSGENELWVKRPLSRNI